MKLHTTGKILICPTSAAIVRTMFGTAAEEENILLSDITINRCLSNMSVNIEKSVSKKMKESNIFDLQVEESIDNGKFI
jgi:hypothetical protein